MKDVKGFCKLFDISVPEYEHFYYYVDQLSKLRRYQNLKDLISLFEKAEEEYGDMYELRMQKSQEIIEFLQNTRAYNELNLDNLIQDYPISKSFQYEEGKKYLSIDIRQANWTVLKRYDPTFVNELPDTYEDLLSKFGLPPIFNHSKSLRQYIFGNINPKRQCKAQRRIIQDLMDTISGLQIECVKHDEVIYSYTDISVVRDIINRIDSSLFKTKLFTIQRVEDFRLDFVMDENENILCKEMVGCNGHRYFLSLKKYIIEEPIDIRDLYFRMDGNLAIWNVENLDVKIK